MTTIALCEHIHDNGSTCGSPALTGYDLCYFHQRLRHPRHRPGDFEYKLPPLDHPHSILMAIQHITQAALDGILETSRARLVLSALRLAQTAYKEMQKAEAKKNADVKTKIDVEAKTNLAPGKEDVVTGNNNVDTGKEDLGTGLIDVGTGALARATRAQLAVPAPATDQPALVGEGSAAAPVTQEVASAAAAAPEIATGLRREAIPAAAAALISPVATSTSTPSGGSPAAAAAPEGSPWRQPWVSVIPTSKAPAGATDKKPPLSTTQAKLLKKILRRGPSHPQFKLAARLLDHQIAGGMK